VSDSSNCTARYLLHQETFDYKYRSAVILRIDMGKNKLKKMRFLCNSATCNIEAKVFPYANCTFVVC